MQFTVIFLLQFWIKIFLHFSTTGPLPLFAFVLQLKEFSKPSLTSEFPVVASFSSPRKMLDHSNHRFSNWSVCLNLQGDTHSKLS